MLENEGKKQLSTWAHKKMAIGAKWLQGPKWKKKHKILSNWWLKLWLMSQVHISVSRTFYGSYLKGRIANDLLQDEYIVLWKECHYASQPLNWVARATRFTPNVNAPIRRLQLCEWHMPLRLWKALVMYFLSSLLTFSSSHINPWIFCIWKKNYWE